MGDRNKSMVLTAKRNLELSLGDDWARYLSHLRKFFRNGTKAEFDKEIRSFLTHQQIFYHNKFLLAVLNAADVTETTHQAPPTPAVKTEEIVEQHQKSPVKKRRKNEEIVFHPHPIDSFVKLIDFDPGKKNETIRYAAEELFLPDSSLIYGRFLAGCWDNGLEFVDEQAIEILVQSIQVLLKNVLSHCIRQRKHYRITADKKFYYDVGCEIKDPTVKNSITRQKIDNDATELMEPKSSDAISVLSAYEGRTNSRNKISLMDIYKTLQDKNVIPSHSISFIMNEKLTTNL